MNDHTISILARELLQSNAHLGTFEADFGNEGETARLATELRQMGCEVMRTDFGTLLVVTCDSAGDGLR